MFPDSAKTSEFFFLLLKLEFSFFFFLQEASKGPRDIDAQAIMNDLKAKREALDMAIADIKSAIQRSKQVALQSPYDSQQLGEATEPVWIRRCVALGVKGKQINLLFL